MTNQLAFKLRFFFALTLPLTAFGKPTAELWGKGKWCVLTETENGADGPCNSDSFRECSEDLAILSGKKKDPNGFRPKNTSAFKNAKCVHRDAIKVKYKITSF